MKEISIPLSTAQYYFFLSCIETGVALGDCWFKKGRLHMDDYEGANAMVRLFEGHKPPDAEVMTTRAYVTREAVLRKLNAAIVAGLGAVSNA